MAKLLAILALALTLSSSALGQHLSNLRLRVVAVTADTIRIDTLSIIPQTLSVLCPLGSKVDTSLFSVSFARAELYPKAPLRSTLDSVVVKYRVFPVLFERTYTKRVYQQYLSPDSLMGREPPRFRVGTSNEPLFGEQIQTNGSLMRGIRFGNNQNLSVNSSMNLTLSGELPNGLMVEGAISDQNIPVQPDGTTRRLEEFDRIYLKVHRENFSVQAGDIELRTRRAGEFMSFTRNLQGLAYGGKFHAQSDTLTVTTSLGVPKGKFARNLLQGVEGNQGPYRLQGANSEPYVIVLSASEKVYVDGVLLTRGNDEHYIIDYNAAEVTFTHRMPINRNSRIVIEFEYSERSYSRYNAFAHVASSNGNWGWHFAAFSEHDNRHQPFDQELTNEQKAHLASIGNNLSQAYFAQAKRVDYDPDKVLYQKIDTLVDGLTYTVFKLSSSPENEAYSVFFSFVGQGKGNYIPDFGKTNGRTYRWVSPLNGQPQGSFEPIRRLVTPQVKQMVQAGASRLWGKNSKIVLNYALSNSDLNTFSNVDNNHNVGHGVHATAVHRFKPTADSLLLAVGATLVKTTSNFRSIDRFRDVEFERSWSIARSLNGGNELMSGAWLEVKSRGGLQSKLTGENFILGKNYSGSRGSVGGQLTTMQTKAQWDVSATTSSDTAFAVNFYRGRISLRHGIGLITLGALLEAESSLSKKHSSDSLTPQSFSWYSIKSTVSTPDSLKSVGEVTYTLRNDYKPYLGQLSPMGSSHEVAIRGRSISARAGTLEASLGYRTYSPTVEFKTADHKQEQTALSRLAYSNRMMRGLWTLAAAYELGSGLEPDMEFYFIEVPAGQGVYTWVDYNGNGVKELGEFEVANYPDQAQYIRINIPGMRMVTVRSSSMNVVSTINPASVVKSKGALAKQVARISNQTSFRIQQKNRREGFWESSNPLQGDPTDTLLVSMSENFRSSLSYNRTSRIFGLEYLFQQGLNKMLLANGFEIKELKSNRLSMWLGFGSLISTRSEVEQYTTSSQSEYFVARSFSIKGYNAQQSVKYLGNQRHTVEAGYKFNRSQNDTGRESLWSNTFYLQADFTYAAKGSLLLRGAYVYNTFEGVALSAVAYEMMKGLQSGRNATWEVSVKRRLSKLFELEVGYNGRYLSTGQLVHSGYMQARALF